MSKTLPVFGMALKEVEFDALSQSVGETIRSMLNTWGWYEPSEIIPKSECGVTDAVLWVSVAPEKVNEEYPSQHPLLRDEERGTFGTVHTVFSKDLPDGINCALCFSGEEFKEAIDKLPVIEALHKGQNPFSQENLTLTQRMVNGQIEMMRHFGNAAPIEIGVTSKAVIMVFNNDGFAQFLNDLRNKSSNTNRKATFKVVE